MNLNLDIKRPRLHLHLNVDGRSARRVCIVIAIFAWPVPVLHTKPYLSLQVPVGVDTPAQVAQP